VVIPDKLNIVNYTNQKKAEKADKNAKAHFWKFEEFCGLLENSLNMILEKFGKVKVKKIWFTGKELPLFLRLFSQQLHEIFIKNPVSTK
jgi:hypothetical protein